MARRGENIYRRKDGRWEGRFVKKRVGRKTIFGYAVGNTYAETKRKLVIAHSVWLAGEESAVLAKCKLETIGDDWLAMAKALLKESTVAKYAYYMRCYILPEFGGMDMNDITDADVSVFWRKLLVCGGKKKGGLSTKVVAEAVRILKSLRKFALGQGVAVGFSADCEVIKQTKKSLRIFSRHEQESLRAYLVQNITLTKLGILLCLVTGIRLGEICALKWDDISLDNREMCVHETMQRIRDDDESHTAKTKIVITPPKSDSSCRIIPLSENVCAILKPFYKPGAYLLTGSAIKPVEPRTMQNRFKAVLKECNIADANFHALRHTFATRCVEMGMDIKCLSEILGHANITMTLSRYVHPSMEAKREIMEKISY